MSSLLVWYAIARTKTLVSKIVNYISMIASTVMRYLEYLRFTVSVAVMMRKLI